MTENVQQLNDPVESVGMLAGTVSYGVKRAYLRVIRDLEDALAPHGFTPPLLAALSIAGSNPGIAPARLAMLMGHGRSRAAPLLDRLQENGLLERRAGANRRSLGLHVTWAGEAMLRRLAPVLEAHERRVTTAFTESARRDLAAALERVAGAP